MYLSELMEKLNEYQPSSNDDFELFMADGLPVTAFQLDIRRERIYLTDDADSTGLLQLPNSLKSKKGLNRPKRARQQK